MQEATLVIPLNREKVKFEAGIAYVKGNLNQFVTFKNRLHSEEEKVLNNYRYDLRKTSYLAGRLSAKNALIGLFKNEKPENFWIDSGVFQFPLVRNPQVSNIQVSISHCDHLGLSIAFPEAHPMGIDIEEISPEKEETLLTQILDAERLVLQRVSLDNLTGFTAIWSMKEAMSKVIKTGMMLDFNTFELAEMRTEKGVLISEFKYFAQYKALTYLGEEYAVSIVLPRKTDTNLSLIFDFLKSM